jgi:hypothetical protein
VALSTNQFAHHQLLHVVTERGYLADELVADDQWRSHIRLHPVVPRLDVQVGPPDPRAQGAHEHVITSDPRLGRVAQDQARIVLSQGPHVYQRCFTHQASDIAEPPTRTISLCSPSNGVGLAISSGRNDRQYCSIALRAPLKVHPHGFCL